MSSRPATDEDRTSPDIVPLGTPPTVPPGNPDDLFTAAEFARFLGHGPRWGTEMFRRGRIPTVTRFGSSRRFATRRAIEEFVTPVEQPSTRRLIAD